MSSISNPEMIYRARAPAERMNEDDDPEEGVVTIHLSILIIIFKIYSIWSI